ncbi:MAG: hypothetical protein ACJ0F6_01355 [Acidimicrobiales bacterium]
MKFRMNLYWPPRNWSSQSRAALDDWIAANGAPGSSLAVLLPDGSEVLVASGVQDLRAGRRRFDGRLLAYSEHQ